MRADPRAVELSERPVGTFEKGAACVGKAHLTRGPQQQLRPEFLLELSDRDAERRLGHVQPFGGSTEVELLSDRHEVPKMTKLEHPGVKLLGSVPGNKPPASLYRSGVEGDAIRVAWNAAAVHAGPMPNTSARVSRS